MALNKASLLACPSPRLIVVTMPDVYTPDELHEGLSLFTTELKKRKEKVIVIVDFAKVRKSEAKNRERAAAFFREEKETLKRSVTAWAFVVPNPVVRGIVTAISWLVDWPVPTKLFENEAAAKLWLERKLAAS